MASIERAAARGRRAIATITAIAVLAVAVPSARADGAECPAVAPSDAEVARRLAWIDRRFEDTEPEVRLWWGAFVAFQTLLVGVQLSLLFAADEDRERIDPIVSGAGSAVGLATLFVFFPPILGAGDLMRSLPRGTREQRLASLRVAEARLRASAAASRDVRNDISGIASVLYTEAAALTLLFLGETTAAFMQAGGGIAVGLGRMLLHPTGAIDAWRVYSARHPDAGCERIAARDDGLRFAIAPAALGRAAGGLTLSIGF